MNFDILSYMPLQVLVHLFSALAAFFLGAFILLYAKGTAMHKTLGWIWVSLMTVVAVSAIFISGPFIEGYQGSGLPGMFGFTLIHLFVILTLVSLPKAIIAIRKRKVKKHKSEMMGLYFGAMLIAGGFTFLPGRLMHEIFFG